MSAYERVKSNKLTTNSHSYKIYVSSFTFSPKFVFSFVWQANGIEMRPILCSIKKIRFLCNFTGPPLEKCCIFFLSFSNTNIIKFGEKILKEKKKCFEVKKTCKFQTLSIIVRRNIHLHTESQKYMYSFPVSESLLYQTGLKFLFRKKYCDSLTSFTSGLLRLLFYPIQLGTQRKL